MTPISLYDTLHLRPTSHDRIDFRCQSAGTDAIAAIPTGGENIVVQSLELLRQRSGCQQGIAIDLVKRIPAAAGLGGGSSDAAAALVAANTLWRLGWTSAQLEALSAELGSDIPFFVRLLAGGRPAAAVCRGRGELLEPVGRLAPLHAVVVRPPVGLSTADVYRTCSVPQQPRTAAALIASLKQGFVSQAAQMLYNALEPAAAQLSEWIARLREEFERLEFLGHQLTGSGACYFGLCRHRRHALALASRLAARQLGSVYVVQTAN